MSENRARSSASEWAVPERRLSAIFAADIAGYSKAMHADESGAMRALQATRRIVDRLIAGRHGRIANTAGDSVLAEFASVMDAVCCAVAIQRALAEAEGRRRSSASGSASISATSWCMTAICSATA
ncbi:hypothetical protein ACRBEV_00495 [Methylobacterium phyllosphaerae]